MKVVRDCPTCGTLTARVEHGGLIPLPRPPLRCPNGHLFEEMLRDDLTKWEEFCQKHLAHFKDRGRLLLRLGGVVHASRGEA